MLAQAPRTEPKFDLAEWVKDGRRTQGLPAYVEDRAGLAKVAAVINATTVR